MNCIFEGPELASEAARYNVVSFCHEDYVSDYTFGKGNALILATRIELVNESPKEYEIVAETVTTVIADDINRLRDALNLEAII